MFIRPNAGRVTSHFNPSRKNPVHGRVQPHTGVDFGRDGSPTVIAAADGTVTRARVMGGYGNCVTIKHVINGKTYETLYAHLKSFSVKVNDKVKAGVQIGIRGSTGASTGEHLHFSIFTPYYKEGLEFALNPLHYIIDPDVKELQQLLNSHGYKLIVDGLRGNSTDKAVIDFQKKNGLTPDGIVGKLTLDKLKSNLVNKTQPQKGMNIRMFNPSSATLKQAVINELTQAAKDKIIDNKWLVQLQQGKLSLDDALALKFIIDQRKNKK